MLLDLMLGFYSRYLWLSSEGILVCSFIFLRWLWLGYQGSISLIESISNCSCSFFSFWSLRWIGSNSFLMIGIIHQWNHLVLGFPLLEVWLLTWSLYFLWIYSDVPVLPESVSVSIFLGSLPRLSNLMVCNWS